MIKVVVVDDYNVLSEGIKMLIETDKDIKVVGCASNGFEAMDLCQKHQPDILLMDIKMPGCDGLEATRNIKRSNPEIKIIIFTNFNESEDVLKALDYGADGYVMKTVKVEDLITLIKSTYNGLRIVNGEVYDTVVKQLSKIAEFEDNIYEVNKYNLSEKELEIIRLIVFGKSNKEIASSIHLSEGRIKNIITDILKKMEAKDRTQLAIFAVKTGLV